MKTNGTERQDGTGQFAKGTSGNPAGRPRGSRNKVTLLIQAMLEGKWEPLTLKAMEMALAGDSRAMKLCMERLMAPRKDRAVHFDLPSIRTREDIAPAMTNILGAMSEGNITPQEGEVLTRILEVQANVLSTSDFERRLAQLEQTISTDNNENADTVPIDAVQRIREGRFLQVVNRD